MKRPLKLKPLFVQNFAALILGTFRYKNINNCVLPEGKGNWENIEHGIQN